MADIIRWNPYREMVGIRRLMDHWFEDLPRVGRLDWDTSDGHFPLDLYETDEAVVMKAALPGVRPEDVEITITGDTLTIKGEAKREEEEKGRDYYRQETWYGNFARSLTLPSQVESDKAEAVFENGILKLTVPKAEAARPKTIKITPREMIEAKK